MVVYLMNKYSPAPLQCKADVHVKNDQQPTPIKLDDLLGVFVLLLGGLSLSVITVILEKIMWAVKKHK